MKIKMKIKMKMKIKKKVFDTARGLNINIIKKKRNYVYSIKKAIIKLNNPVASAKAKPRIA